MSKTIAAIILVLLAGASTPALAAEPEIVVEIDRSEIYEGEIYAQRVLEGLSETLLPDPAHLIALYQNHPNPFNPVTSITFSLFRECNIALEIYDTQGREVKKVMDEDKIAGTYVITWDATRDGESKVGSGIYMIHMKAGKYSKTRKIAVVK